jgi:DNA-binding winged helix-turn-helix (wHTH) protein/tetratricopeptide (TPR) repeat protein
MSLANQGSYQFGDFHLNLDLRVLVRRGERVPLGSKAFDVLTFLVSRAGEIVTKPELFAAVWAESFVEEGALSQQIFTLRKALGDKADYIVTVPGQGYRFMGEVRRILPASPASLVTGWDTVVQETLERRHIVIEESAPPMIAAGASRSGIRRYAVAAAVLVAAGMLLAGWMWLRRPVPRDFQKVVLADFMNTTGDAAFESTLKRALEVDLTQSPYFDVMTERDSADTLKKMGLKTDTAVTPEVAREICERTNRQILLTGSIATVGGEYLLTLEAADCATGKRITAAKAEIAEKSKVLGALDLLVEHVRSRLGESAKSIHSFDIPFEDAATPSLEALKSYSIGKHMQAQGKPYPDILKFFQRAVEIDPHFAQGYEAVGMTYYNLSEPLLAAENLKKAFDLRDGVDAKEKLNIEAHYYDLGQDDVLAGIKAYQLWADTYPHDWQPWLAMANSYIQLGQNGQAIAAAQHAVQLDGDPVCYIVLARGYKNDRRFAEAKAAAADAIHRGKDTTGLQWILYEVAFDEHDAAALAREDALLASRKDGLHDYFAAKTAAIDGKYTLAESLFRHEIAVDRQEGLTEEADNIAVEQAQMEQNFGYPELARATLNHLGKEEESDPDFALERAMLGDVVFSKQFLAAHSHDEHPGTAYLYDYKPAVEASIAMAQGKPLDAIAILEAPTPYVVRSMEARMLEGDAFLQVGQFQRAAEQFRSLVDKPPFNAGVNLAHLGLARAFAKAGDPAKARAEYQAFLAAWKDADPDLPVLKTAKMELATLH